MPIQATLVLGFIGVIAARICIYIFIMPEGKYRTLNSFCRWLSDLFNFRTLWLESIIKFFYVLSTVICVIFGFLMLFSVIEYYHGYSEPLALFGLLLLIAGPVVIRLVYEGTMMFILLVKNTMQINNRLRNAATEPAAEAETAAPAAPVIEYCEKCGKQIEDDTIFCSNCGNKVR